MSTWKFAILWVALCVVALALVLGFIGFMINLPFPERDQCEAAGGFLVEDVRGYARCISRESLIGAAR